MDLVWWMSVFLWLRGRKYKIGGILAWDNSSDIRGRDANNNSLDGSLTHCISQNIKEHNELKHNNTSYMVSYANVVYPINIVKNSIIPVKGVHMKKPSHVPLSLDHSYCL